jgi:hypothetical protein
MKFNRLGAFTLGVVITAVSVGAVSFVNAAGNGTLKACANKTTGVMRYISKGSCKKTETSLSWNQMGPTGLPGSAGTNGTAGTKGDTGAAGTNGTAGTNGQNYYAVDATGKTLGPVLGNFGSNVDVLIDNMIWTLDKASNIVNMGGVLAYHSNSSCTAPYFTTGIGTAIITQGVTTDSGSNDAWDQTDKAYKVSGSQISLTGQTIYSLRYVGDSVSLSCGALSDVAKAALALTTAFYPLVEVTKPTYTAPLTIVAK